VQEYNVTVRQVPTNLTAMIFGMKEKPQFTVDYEKGIARPPKVDFGGAAALAAAAVRLQSPSAQTRDTVSDSEAPLWCEQATMH
jgi:hypothetical protein